MENLNQIIKQFPEVGEVKEVKALTSGLINQTYLVKTVDPQEADYVLQRINHQIFTDIDMLQHNIEVVTGHIRKKLEAQNETDIDRKVLRFLPATDGKTFWEHLETSLKNLRTDYIDLYQYSFPVHRLWKLSLPTLLIWQV